MIVRVEPTGSATVSLPIQLESDSPDAFVAVNVGASSSGSISEPFAIQDARINWTGYVASWEHPEMLYLFSRVSELEFPISDIRYSDTSLPSGIFEGYHSARMLNISLGPQVREAQRFFSDRIIDRMVSSDSLTVTGSMIIKMKTEYAAQEMGGHFFVDISFFVRPGARFSFELSVPTDAVVTQSSSNLVQYRPNVWSFASVGPPQELESGGRFYIEYEWIPWILRSPQKEIIISIIIGSVLSAVIRKMLDWLYRKMLPRTRMIFRS